MQPSQCLLFTLLATAVTHAAEQRSPLDRVVAAYSPYVDANDPLGMPMKLRALASDPYTFWRGSRDLFFQWTRDHARDWIGDKAGYVPSHGDVHLGNIGTYASDGGWGALGFGLVDFDESARLPFQFDLLQAVVTLTLVAEQKEIRLTAEEREAVLQQLFESYKIALDPQRKIMDLLVDEPMVDKLLLRGKKKQYAEELEKFTQEGRFRASAGSKGKVTDLLDPIDRASWRNFAIAISEAARSDSRLAALLSDTDTKALEGRIKGIVRRTRTGSSGSQGLGKYLVLLDKPFKGVDSDVLIYLKEQIPPAAERAGVIAAQGQNAATRSVEIMNAVNAPRSIFCGATTLGQKSFWVSLKEPWSDELDHDQVADARSLLKSAKILGTVLGGAHRSEGRHELIANRLSAEMRAAIVSRADAYAREQNEMFRHFKQDPKLPKWLKLAEAALSSRSRTP